MASKRTASSSGGDGCPKRKSCGIFNKRKVCRKELHINSMYTSEKFKKSIHDALTQKIDATLSNSAKVVMEPFPHCFLPDFLGPNDVVENVICAVKNLPFRQKCNDLYKLSQSDDFKGIKEPGIITMRNFVNNNFHKWMSDVSGCSLNQDVDISAACYGINDFLLCHNDLFENRKIAFIYYLVDEDWQEEDGGLFQLFGQGRVESTLVPQKNMMLFFEVTPVSYHQVTEVLVDKKRYTVSGWFHSSVVEVIEVMQKTYTDSAITPGDHSGQLSDYINEFYINPNHIKKLRQQFERDSEIMLFSFLREDVYSAVAKELNECKRWTTVGPPFLKSYHEIKRDDLPSITSDLFNFLHSKTFFTYLSSLVSLSLNRKKGFSPSFVAEVSKFVHGSYSLLQGGSHGGFRSALSSVLFFNCPDWDEAYGGTFSFISMDGDEKEKESIIDIVPIPNSLSLVYHEQEVTKFVKYVNNKVNCFRKPYYQCFSSELYENQRVVHPNEGQCSQDLELPKNMLSVKRKCRRCGGYREVEFRKNITLKKDK